MVSLLLPIAGHSSRFPNLNPKWSLTHPRGYMMVVEAIRGLDLTAVERIYVIGLREHDEAFQLRSALSEQFAALGLGDVTEFVLLDERTASQPESIARGIRQAGITGPIYIKDSDNYFRDRPTAGNSIAGYDLHLLEKVDARSKSYFEVNGDGYVTNVVEKRIVSSRFCVGGYSFLDAAQFLEYFDRYAAESQDLYISTLVYGLILDDVPFRHTEVEEYVDWGTLREWRTYTTQYSTLFVDLDGTLVFNSAQYTTPRWGESDGIQANIDVVNHLYDSGKVHVVITTARKESYRDATYAQLDRLGVQFHSVVFDLPHGKRIVVNDYAPSNPFKSAEAINIKRNSSDLKEMLEDSIGFHLGPPTGAAPPATQEPTSEGS